MGAYVLAAVIGAVVALTAACAVRQALDGKRYTRGWSW